jgi:pimeloyl-ACP methyl ester carboxylesterase
VLPHWHTVVRPFLEALDPGPIIEIGAYEGSTTSFLAELAAERNIILHVVDPAPQFDVTELEKRFPEHFRFHKEKSHDALERIGPAAAVLIDGDHNWYTVHGELTRLEQIAKSGERDFPLVMFHDVEWPYARRDMYYDPDGIPEGWRKPWSHHGLKWGERLLGEAGEGISKGVAKALEEGGAHNGVLTAIEDFIEESEIPVELRIVSGNNGIGILAANKILDTKPAVRLQWDKLLSPEFLLDHAKRLSQESMRMSVVHMEASYKIESLEHELREAKEEVATVQTAPDTLADSQDAVVFHSTPGDSETVIVAFSSRGAENGHFHFFELGRVVPEPAKLLVRDPAENWYNTGLPGVGDTVDDIAERIREEIAKLGVERILTIGSSMGGYAAILFGCMIGAERAIALVPQTLLDPGLPQRRPSADVKLQVADLKPIVSETPQTRIDLVVALDDLLDVFHAQRIASFPSVRILGLPDVGHSFGEELNKERKYYPLITDLIEGRTPSVGELQPAFEAALVEQLARAAYAQGRGDRRAAMQALVPVAERYPSWTAPPLIAVRSAIEGGVNMSSVN